MLNQRLFLVGSGLFVGLLAKSGLDWLLSGSGAIIESDPADPGPAAPANGEEETHGRESEMLAAALAGESAFKLVLVARTDLKMGKGKLCAQCCHAALGVYRSILQRGVPAHLASLEAWDEGGEAKVVVKAESEERLRDLAGVARSLSLPTYLVRDAGRTQIAPGTVTVLAVGPGPVEMVDVVTGKLTLM